MARKNTKKTVRKTSKKTTKIAKKSLPRNSKKMGLESQKTRSQTCILVCGKDRCVEACTTSSGAVTGECIPCPICGHGHFCENDFECLSCGATRELVVRPYKGA